MSNTVIPGTESADNTQSPVPPVNQKPKAAKNKIGLIALIVAVLGFIFSCIPGALGLGWFLLFVGFVLGIVALFQRDKAKGLGIAAIIVSIVGTIVGIIVFMAVMANAVSDAFGGTESKVSSPESSASAGASSTAEAPANDAGETGTRENPAALGSTVESDDWAVKINSVSLDANAAVAKENQFNEKPDKGSVYIMINYTTTYKGDDADGQMPAMVGVDYVTAGGETFDGTEKMVTAPKQIDSTKVLYKGASTTGNTVIQVPTPVDGVIAVRPGMLADKVFVAVK